MCDKCTEVGGYSFSCYNALDKKTYEKLLCVKCLQQIVENYFSPVKMFGLKVEVKIDGNKARIVRVIHND